VLNRFGWEIFREGRQGLGFTLQNLWERGQSDLGSNGVRGALAEFVVARALEADRPTATEPGLAWDITSRSGVRLKVASAAQVAGWSAERRAAITFDIAPRWGWNETRNRPDDALTRPADVYVFALLQHPERGAPDLLDVSHWTFFVASARAIDQAERAQPLITLRTLEARGRGADTAWRGPLPFRTLKLEVESLGVTVVPARR
jgi:hypothetical protein